MDYSTGAHGQMSKCSNDKMGKCPGGLAQLARAPALQAGGQRFESVILHGLRANTLYFVHSPFVT